MNLEQLISLITGVGVFVLLLGVTVLVVQVGAMFRSLGGYFREPRAPQRGPQ